MKRKIILVCALMYMAHIATAQRFGIEGGLNISKPSGLNGSFAKSLLGIHLGPIVEFSLSNKVFMSSGLLYSVKGFKYDESSLVINDPLYEGSGIITHSFGYLEVPIMLVYKIPVNENKLKLFFQGGPNISYCVNHSPSEVTINKFDYGINFGTGIERKSIKLGLNYNIGLREIWPNNYDTNHQRVFRISVAYMFKGN
jgi:hypothetical protein